MLPLLRVHGTHCFTMDSDQPLSDRSRSIETYNGFWTSVQNRLCIWSDYVATQFGRPRSIVKLNGFWTSKQNRLSIPGDPDSLHVGLLHRSGKKLVVGILLVDVGFDIARVRIHWKTQWILSSESESIVFYRSPWLHHGDLQNTMDSDAVARIPCVFQWIVNSPSSHIDFGLQANFSLFFRSCWMCGADRLVLVVNDECLSDSALRGGHFVSIFPEFVAPLSWNGRSSKCRLHLNVFPQFVWLLLGWEY